MVGGEGFRDGDEPDGGRIASDPAGRSRDAVADVGQPGAERGRIVMHPLGVLRTRYCGSCAASALAGGRIRSVRRELHVCVEFAARALEIALVHERHSQLVVRLGVIGLRRNHLLERGLGLGNFSCVPENDALVVRRVRRCRRRRQRAAASSAAFLPASCARSNFRWLV